MALSNLPTTIPEIDPSSYANNLKTLVPLPTLAGGHLLAARFVKVLTLFLPDLLFLPLQLLGPLHLLALRG